MKKAFRVSRFEFESVCAREVEIPSPIARIERISRRTGVNVLDGDLEAIERAGFRNLNLAHETNAEVFEHDAVRGGEERKHVRDKVLLILRERLPVLHVVRQIDFFRCLRTKARAIASMYRQSRVPFALRSLARRAISNFAQRST